MEAPNKNARLESTVPRERCTPRVSLTLKAERLKQILFAALASLGLMTTAESAEFTGTLALLYPMADGSIALGFTGAASGCGTAGPIVYMYLASGHNGVSAEGFKSIYSTVLMAFASEKTIDVNYDNSSLYCYVNRLLVR